MKTTFYPFLVAALVSSAFPQALTPNADQLTEKHKAELALLGSQLAAAQKQAQTPYTTALSAAEKTATATRNVPATAAIAAERTALTSGLMPPAFPPALPRDLQMPRKTYLDATARTRAAELSRRQTIDADYLHALMNLQARDGANPELAKLIAVERANLLAIAPAKTIEPLGSASMAKSNSKNAIVNGNFDLADASGRPTGWTLTANAEQNSKVVQEGSNHVLRMAAGAIEYTSISQVVPLPPRAKSVTISGRIRGKWETHDTTHQDWGASIYAVNVGADSAPFGDWIGLNGGREAGWRSQSQSAKIAAGSKGIRVECTLKFISGTFDFDDINVEFH